MFGRSEQLNPVSKSIPLWDVEPPKSVNIKVEKAQLSLTPPSCPIHVIEP